jgi:phage terminase small subunit
MPAKRKPATKKGPKKKHHGPHGTIPAPRRPLTRLRERFVAEYLVDLNATAAYERAGGSARVAGNLGPRLMRTPAVLEAIDKAMAARNARTGITADRVLAELEPLAFSNVSHYAVDMRGDVTLAPGAPPEAWRAVRSIKRRILIDGTIKVEIELWDKPGTLKLAGRHVGLFPDKVEVSFPKPEEAKAMLAGLLGVKPEDLPQ